jgi:hypothetical protein
MAVVVSDALPLICLGALGQVGLLRQLCGEVVIPYRRLTGERSHPPQRRKPAADAQAAGCGSPPQSIDRWSRSFRPYWMPPDAEAIAPAVRAWGELRARLGFILSRANRSRVSEISHRQPAGRCTRSPYCS